MSYATHKLAIVIPTIGRYAALRHMLVSLAQQTRLPEQVLIVGEGEGNAEIAREFPQLNAEFISFPGSSICDARNRGAQVARPDIDLIAFMDDDIVLDPRVIETLLDFWDQGPEDLGGTGCNIVNYPAIFAPRLKALRLTSRLGLYDSRKGIVMRSGIQTRMTGIKETTYVQWLASYAVVYSRRVLRDFSWDEWFETYSYLEDLDFSYRVGKMYKLAVLPHARFYHYPSEVGRPNGFLFGKKEVANRLHFVSKHRELSVFNCVFSLLVQILINVIQGVLRREVSLFERAWGNCVALASTLTRGLRPVAS